MKVFFFFFFLSDFFLFFLRLCSSFATDRIQSECTFIASISHYVWIDKWKKIAAFPFVLFVSRFFSFSLSLFFVSSVICERIHKGRPFCVDNFDKKKKTFSNIKRTNKTDVTNDVFIETNIGVVFLLSSLSDSTIRDEDGFIMMKFLGNEDENQ